MQEKRDIQLDELIDQIRKYHPEDDLDLVTRAYHFAQTAHEGHMRKSGKPYFTHPYRVATILAELMLDATTIAAGLLHDCVEDIEEITVEVITAQFGQEVAQLVDGVTKLTRLNFISKEEQQAESLRKMFLAMAKDIRVVLIKLADRLHNMRTLKFQPVERQRAIARETLDVYAPLAHRLGMFAMKWELEDLAFRYTDPAGYYALVEKVGMKRAEREDSIRTVISVLTDKLEEQGIKAQIEGRPKHLYSIYKKMVLQNKPFEQIYDLIAIRVLVKTVPECYAVLGVVHTLWTQVPNRFKDYISVPKPNLYQSLHTTMVGLRGLTFEVQIRTHEMHSTAEYGIAAHWRYKEGRQADELDRKMYWLRQILDWQDETRDSKEFMDTLKTELFSDEVFVFTPKGDVIALPRNATPIDFAYRIHSEIGNKCVGAKVNGRITTLDRALKTGDFVEVMTSASSRGPSMDWLKIVKSNEARTKIRAWFKRELKDENTVKGKDMLEREAKHHGYSLAQLIKADQMEQMLARYSLSSPEDLYAMVGFGGLSTGQVLNRLIEEQKKQERQEAAANTAAAILAEAGASKPAPRQVVTDHGVRVEGEPGMLVRFARCCNPLPGDDIVGYITRGRGVSVHRTDCVNMTGLDVEQERRVTVSWEGNVAGSYDATIQIISYDRPGILADISTLFTQMNIPVKMVTARTNKNKTSNMMFTLTLKDTQQLDSIIRQLNKRSDVIEVFRTAS